eukprot:scaffold3068_cov401-Prasinococcus_capsulatus_cf.AAC.56
MLDDVTGLHVYSLQAALPKNSADLWNSERDQSLQLFEDSPQTSNCLRDNRFSSISCDVVRDPTKPILNTAPVPASTMSTSKSKITPAAPRPEPAAKAPQTSTADKKPVSAKKMPSQSKTGGQARMAAMFAKAPPKPVAVTADQAMALEEEDHESDEEEDEAKIGEGRQRRAKKSRALLDDSDDEDTPQPEEVKREPSVEPLRRNGEDAATAGAKELIGSDNIAVEKNTAQPGSPEKSKRRKIEKTILDDDGNERTELIWVGEDGVTPIEAPEEEAKDIPQPSSWKQPQEITNKERPKPPSAKKPAAKQIKGQRSIASFFTKKA